MDVSAILMLLVAKFPSVALILAALGALVVFAQAIVLISPSKSDDAVLDKIMAVPVVGALVKALVSFAPIQRKE